MTCLGARCVPCLLHQKSFLVTAITRMMMMMTVLVMVMMMVMMMTVMVMVMMIW